MLEPSRAPEPTRLDPLSFLERQLAEPMRPDAIAFVVLPARIGCADLWLRSLQGEQKVLWHPPSGAVWAGVGATERVRGTGHDRYEHVRERAHSVWCRLRAVTHPDAMTVSPRCLGGLAFTPGGASDPPWEALGDAFFVLPRLAYVIDSDRAALVVTATAAELASIEGRSRLCEQAERALSCITGGASRLVRVSAPLSYRPGQPCQVDELSRAHWGQLVSAVREQIEAGRFDKIVLSRRTQLQFDRPVDASSVLEQLRESAPSCVRFAFQFGGPTFLGATPERLIRKEGLDIETEALAGSSALGEPAARALLASDKERTEHDLVVREILHSLTSLSVTLDHPPTPVVRELRHLVHLQTPIRGRLKAPLHVLRLAERLHPTPAVGGVPTAQSVAWIRDHEPHPRGWYAGPIGWFDAAGDGELWVSLRSGVIDDKTAYLYAGSGIVRDSDPEREYDETRLKLASLSSALRIAT